MLLRRLLLSFLLPISLNTLNLSVKLEAIRVVLIAIPVIYAIDTVVEIDLTSGARISSHCRTNVIALLSLRRQNIPVQLLPQVHFGLEPSPFLLWAV